MELYIRMSDYLSADIQVTEAERPYIHTFIHGERTYKVGVVWDNAVSFLENYRWAPPRERVILVCQSVKQVDGLLNGLNENIPIRIITREKLKESLVFYRSEDGRWVLDIPERQIKTKPSTRIIHKHRILLS